MKEAIGRSITRTSTKSPHSNRRSRGIAVVLAATAMTVSTRQLHATTYTWDPGNTPATPSGGSGTWDLSNTSDWSNGSANVQWTDSAGTNDTAIFAGTAGTVSQNANLGAAEVIFQKAGYSINSGANILLLATAGTTLDTSAIGSGAASLGNVDIGATAETWNVGSAALSLNGAVRDNGQSSTTLTVNGTGTTQFTGGLTFASGSGVSRVTVTGSENINISGLVQDGNNGGNFLIYDGTGTLALSGTANTFGTGTSVSNVDVDSGVVSIASAGSLGSSSNILAISNNTANATFQGTGSSTIAIANPVTLAGGGGGAAVFAGSTPLNFTGNVTSTGAVENVTVNNTALTTISGNLYLSGATASEGMVVGGTGNVLISGMVSDNALEGPGINPSSLTFNSTGTMTLSNSGNNFSGNLAVDNGTLVVYSGAAGSTAKIVLGNNTSAAVPIFEGNGTSTISFANPVSLGGGGGSASIIGGSTPLNFTGTVTGNGSSDDLNVNNTALTTFSGTFYLGNSGSRTVNIGGTGNLLISAPIGDTPSGPGPCTLVYLGTGTLTLNNASANSSFTGNMVAENGTIIVANDGSLGSGNTLALGPASGTPTLNPTFEGMGSSPETIAHVVTIDSASANSSSVTIGGTTPLNFSNNITINTASTTTEDILASDTGGVTFSSNVYLANGGTSRKDTFGGTGNLNITGVVANGTSTITTIAALAYSGTGTLTLSNANTYTGTTTVNSGEIDVTNTSGSATGTNNVTLNGGTLASGSVGSISGNVLAGTAAHTIAPGGIGSIGTLTIGGLTSSSLTTLNFQLGTGSGTITNGSNLILGSGTTSIGSGTLMTFGGTPVAGNDYQLIGDTSSGAVVSTIPLGNFTLPTAPAGLAYALALNSNFIDLDVTSTGPASLTWNNTGAGAPTDGVTWDTTHINWSNSGTPSTYSDGALVTFNDTNNSHYAVTLNSTVHPGSVTINTAATSGSTYTISGSGSIAGTGSLTKTGVGIATLATGNAYTGGTFVNGGTLVIAPTGTNTSALPSNEPVTIGASGELELADNASQSSPFVSSSADISNQNIKLSSLTITSGGKLDIRNNHFDVVDSGGTPDDATYTSILGMIKSGAIMSTEGLTSPNYGVGLVDGNDAVHNTPVSVNEIEVAYTLEGDANLDGKVDASDFSIFAPNFGLNTTLGWEAGDFNYDGKVDASDFSAFAPNFGLQDNGTAVSLPSADYVALDAFAAANGLTVTSVPEPASLGLLTIGTVGLLSRRRRKSQ